MATASEAKTRSRTLTEQVNEIFKRADDIISTQQKKFSPEVLEHYAEVASEKRSAEARTILGSVKPAREERKAGAREFELRGPVTREGALETMAFVKALEEAKGPGDLNIRKWTTTRAEGA